MNTPTDRNSLLTSAPEYIHINRMLLSSAIIISQDSQLILYQVPFELTKSPSRGWKEVMLETWQSVIQNKEYFSNTVIWIIDNRIIINKVSIEQVKNELETLVAIAVESTNKKMN